ncbi:hypothetical protein TPB0596_22440 [Tsukamurella pulmonis]|uniref:hypothetical protein n=1 Tax=Tsukamurella pulmonis TaxID=47312 RepID=UPI000794367A|nr:hypothetical protein [Tsukamurella pulmonis]KXP09230.1 hypothetical protein AXK57_14550 [Tsukamurella pulmonis]RDH12524.1 hypothetical protein DVB88_07080 [Tsukamurella pulmonis]BDD82481.1 hypothetical protein TPB0596_22440 [Tsukamurella pulmonis]
MGSRGDGAGYQTGLLVGLVTFVIVAGALTWLAARHARRERFLFRPADVLLGFGLAWVGALVFAATVRRSDFVTGFAVLTTFAFALALALGVAAIRSRRDLRRERASMEVARAAIPAAAREYFASAGFRSALAGMSVVSPPRPETASEVIAYWAYRALDSGDYVEGARLIHEAAALAGWTVASPSLAAAVPRLTAPFLAGDERRDPAIDRGFRDCALALLSARFGQGARV